MKKITSFCLLILILSGASSAKINLPKADKITLDNGMTVMVIDRRGLPLFSIKLTFRAGSVHDPEGKEGLAGLCNEMLMRGTSTRTARQIAEEVAFGGGTLGNFCNREDAGFAGEFLSDQGEKGFEILADILTNSAFADEEIEKIRTRTIAQLKSRLEHASSVASDNFYAVLLGSNRYAHIPQGNVNAIESITKADILNFVQNAYTPDNCLLVVCGDISRSTVENWLKKYLGHWQGRANITPVEADFPYFIGNDVLILDKKDAPQTQIRIGNIGLPIDHPDYIPLEAARTVYGGSFTSRLVNEIRVNRGLSYSVWYQSSRYKNGGISFVSTFTKNETVSEVIDIILAESERMRTEPVPDSELTGAINYRSGLYPLRFETNDHMVNIFSNLWLYGLEKSIYEDYQEMIRTVTPDQAIEVAKKYLPFDNYRLVLVGKADEIKSQAEQYGRVTVKPLDGE